SGCGARPTSLPAARPHTPSQPTEYPASTCATLGRMMDLSSARVLVTGGAGFIGSALVWALNGRDCDRIVVADVLGSDDKWRNLVPLRFEDYVDADDLL